VLQLSPGDRVGLGWRPEIGPAILAHLDRIDVLEVVLDDYFKAPLRKLHALKTLAGQVPLLYHGVSLGLASSFPIDERRLQKLARVLDFLGTGEWSEHLAFVRAGKVEIGHLAAPPRTEATIAGALANLEHIRRVVGSLPVMENIATLIDPPGSRMSEPQWTERILTGSDGHLLLDLHNLYANAVNFGCDPFEFLKAFPLDRVRQVHLSGGEWIDEPGLYAKTPGGRRILDDHVHDVPQIVFDLLEALVMEIRQPITVIIERDGAYPDFQVLFDQMTSARMAITRGRENQTTGKGAGYERAGV
jgi:uncharacterized protein